MGVAGALGVHNFPDATTKTTITANITANIHPYFSKKVFFFSSSAIYFNEMFFYLNYCATIKSAQRSNLAPM